MRAAMNDTIGLFQLEIYISPLLPIHLLARNEEEKGSIIHQVQLPNSRVVVSEELMERIKKAVIDMKTVTYDNSLALIESLMDAAPGLLDEAELEAFALAVYEYEKIHYPIGPPDPDETIKFRREQERE